MSLALKSIVLLVAFSSLATPAIAGSISFTVALPVEMTLVVGVPTAIPAMLVNTGDDPISFGCADLSCGGIEPASPFGISQAHDPYLDYLEGPSGGNSLQHQFADLVLAASESFNFTIFMFTLTTEPPFAIRPEMTFAIQSSAFGIIQAPFFHPVIHAGNQTAIGPLTFPPAVPDHGSVAWIAALVLLGLMRQGGAQDDKGTHQ